jgi:hypothetical protein
MLKKPLFKFLGVSVLGGVGMTMFMMCKRIKCKNLKNLKLRLILTRMH